MKDDISRKSCLALCRKMNNVVMQHNNKQLCLEVNGIRISFEDKFSLASVFMNRREASNEESVKCGTAPAMARKRILHAEGLP